MTIRPDAAIPVFSDHVVGRAVRWLVAGLIVALVPGAAFAYGSYGSAFDAKYGTQGSSIAGNACTVCHTPYPTRNAYGLAFAQSFTQALRNAGNIAQALANIEALDSDGDGVTNIGEIANRKYPGNMTDTPPSTVLPGAPTGVSAAAGNGQATVSFSAPGSDGGSAITTYIVTTSPGGSAVTGTTSPITVTGLSNGNQYTFTVKARTLWGVGLNSTASSAVTPTAPATAPTEVSAVAGNAQATVSFVAPTDNGGTPIISYTVKSSPGGITATGAGSPIVVAGLTNGSAYSFSVNASNSGGSGPASAPSSAVTPAAVVVPVPDSPNCCSFVDAGNAMGILAFDPPADNGSPITGYTAICSYSLVQGVTLSFTASGRASPLIIDGLSNGTTYQCKLSATNAFGSSLAAGNAQFTPFSPAPPSIPTAITAVPDNGQVILTFGSPSNDGGSAVINYTASCKTGGTTLTATGTASPLTITGLTNGTAYACWVTANNAQGTFNSLAFRSPSISVTPAAAVYPDAPSSLSATLNGTDIVASWSAVSGATSYNLYMANQSGVNKANYASLSGGHVHSNATSPYTHPNGTPGATYYLAVTAVNDAGESVGSTEFSIAVPAPANTTTTTTSTTSTTTTTAAPATTTTTAAPTTTTTTASPTTTTAVPATTTTTAAPTTTTTTASATTTTAATTTTTGASATTTAASTTTTASTTSTTLGAAATLSFGTGWNLVGNGSSGSLDAAAFGDSANVNTVWKWIAASAKWAFYTPALGAQALIDYAALKGYEVLTTLTGGEGFWVNAVKPFSVQLPAGSAVQAMEFMPTAGAKPLLKGWSLVVIGEARTPGEFNAALSGLSAAPANPADIPLNLTTLWAWENTLNKWYFYAPSLEKSGDLPSYIGAKGYLDFSANSKTLGQGTGFWVNMP